MTTSKIPPPRKLTESEDIDSFDDWWFQAVCYENFKEFFYTPNFTWQGNLIWHCLYFKVDFIFGVI